jgi:hypothetical protein
MLKVSWKFNILGSIVLSGFPMSAPQLLQESSDSNDIALHLKVFMPMAFAATSSSRMAFRQFPKLLERSFTIT